MAKTKKMARLKSNAVICGQIVTDAERLRKARDERNKREFREYALRYQAARRAGKGDG